MEKIGIAVSLSVVILASVASVSRAQAAGETTNLLHQVEDSMVRLKQLQTLRQVDNALARLDRIQQLRRQNAPVRDAKARLLDLLIDAYAGDDGELSPNELDLAFDDLTEIEKELRDNPARSRSNAAGATKTSAAEKAEPARPKPPEPVSEPRDTDITKDSEPNA